jgi:hypothetical protein
MHRRRLSIAAVFGGLIASSACSPVETIDADAFNRACTSADDCGLVFSGNVCDDCGIKNAAVNRDELERYAARYEAFRQQCLVVNRSLCDARNAPRCENGECAIGFDEPDIPRLDGH